MEQSCESSSRSLLANRVDSPLYTTSSIPIHLGSTLRRSRFGHNRSNLHTPWGPLPKLLEARQTPPIRR